MLFFEYLGIYIGTYLLYKGITLFKSVKNTKAPPKKAPPRKNMQIRGTGLAPTNWSYQNAEIRPLPPKRVFHGTSLENAREIYSTKLWLISNLKPRAVYLTTDLEIAKSFAGKKGAIVDISVKRPAKLKQFRKHYDEGVYIYEIPDGKPHDAYYRIKGLEPVGLLDYKGKKIH